MEFDNCNKATILSYCVYNDVEFQQLISTNAVVTPLRKAASYEQQIRQI